MITFIYGVSGSGKSALLERNIAEDTAAGRRVYLVVPEQQTYIAERRYSEILPASAQLTFEAVNFTRLANIAFRRCGGLSYNYIDKGMKSLLMWRNLQELSPLLSEYGDAAASPVRSGSLTDMMLSVVGELQAAALTPSKLERAADKLPRDSSLYARLRDISLIWASYSNLVSQSYDDAADDLTRLADILEAHDIFADRHIYIDSFTSFTAQEYRVIDLMMKQSASLTVTLGCDAPGSRRLHFASIADASERLRRLADARGGFREVILDGTHRFRSADLALLEKYLWQTDAQIRQDERIPAENVGIICAQNPYAEAEAAASYITEALRGGMRCRDIAVIMRDAASWRGIVDAVFDKFGIPYFLSEHTDLSSKPLIKLLLSTLSIKNNGWRQNDVISLLKTGLCGFSDRETDIFEEYCSTWSITGGRFTGGVWSMNPDGYVTTVSERGRDILRVANEVRERLTAPLLSLFAALDAAQDAADMCRAVYAYTEQLGVRAQLDALAARERSAGDERGAADTLRLYSIYIDTLDKIASALADAEPDSVMLASAMRIIFANANMGALPTRHDEVTIGSASLLRADSPRLVVVMGLCEGEFPADIGDSGIFSFTDRLRLGELGIPLSSDPGLRSSEEMFFVYRALTAASEHLLLSFSESGCDGTRRRMSPVIGQVLNILPSLEILRYDLTSPLTRIQTPETALEYLRSLGNTPEAAVLRAMLEKHGKFADILPSLDIPVADSDCRVSSTTANAVFGENMTLSQSRLDGYVLCPFRYYCGYVLGLRESKPADFSYENAGVFIHYVMEGFMRRAVRDGGFDPDLTDARAESLADEIIEGYIRELIPSDDERRSRMTFLITRLRRIALILIYNIMEEFRHSLFSPSFFELNVDGSAPEFSSPAVFDADGERITLRGVIDRVDLFRRGNDIFIRVIDYKTGSKVYSPDELAEGTGLQLLLYLFALCRSAPDSFRKALGCPPDGRILPAGALYLSANLPVITIDRDISAEHIRSEAIKRIKRSGPVLDDDEILRAMNDGLDPDFLGLPKRAGAKDNKMSSEDFERLCDRISGTLGRISAEMRSGQAAASPRRRGGISPCDNCGFSGVCRSAEPSENKR